MRYGKFLSILILILLIFSCASTSQQDTAPPEWFLNPPPDNKDFRYLTVSIRAPLLKDIEEMAGEKLFEDIALSIGVEPEISSREDFSTMRNEIVGLVKGKQTDGFKLINKRIDDAGTERIIYVLVEMKLSKEQEFEKSFETILRSGSSASIYTDKAEELIAGGDVYNGIISYLKAAIEAADSDNSFLAEKNMDAAIGELRKISISVVAVPPALSVGQSGLFQVKLVSETAGNNAGWKDVPVSVSFRDRKKGGVIGDRTARLRADQSGNVSFIHPSPGFTGKGKVLISLDLLSGLGSYEILQMKYADKYAEFLDALGGASVHFDFDIVSSAHTVPTGIYVVDSDFLRKPLDSFSTAQGILSGLTGGGFDIELLKLDSQPFFNLTDPQLLRDLPYMVKGDYRRIVFGVAQITDFDDSSVGFTVVTEATIKVLDLDSGEILFNETLTKRVQGAESQATISTSFKELGRSFSALLIDKLP